MFHGDNEPILMWIAGLFSNLGTFDEVGVTALFLKYENCVAIGEQYVGKKSSVY